MNASEVVAPIVESFIDEVSRVLSSVNEAATTPSEHLRKDVINEAFNLVVAFVDVDERHTDNELWALTAVFGPLMLETKLAGATPAQLRGSALLAGKAAWLQTPSTLFDILCLADARDGGDRAMAYYRCAMDVCHVLASLDDLATQEELRALGSFRTMLIGHLEAASANQASSDGSNPASSAVPASDQGTAHVNPGQAEVQQTPPPTLEELLHQLDELVGLSAVKAEVKLVTDLLRVKQLRTERGLPSMESSLHLVFVGNPGTGKTTVARLLSQIYRACGALDRGHLVETDRSGLVAGYVGQTAQRVTRKFEEARGGTLFIDEAYTLVRGGENDFGREAIDQIVKSMEDHRDDTALIVAGYPDEMKEFIDSNPGLASRFSTTLTFADYSTDELLEIFRDLCTKNAYLLDETVAQTVRERIDAEPRTKGFGNGRFVRNLFEACVAHQASRLSAIEAPSDDELQRLVSGDIKDRTPA